MPGLAVLEETRGSTTSGSPAGGLGRHPGADRYTRAATAKILCRLQEAILGAFGLTGLLCMQRGINFTIYAILTCTMIHLVSSF